MSKLLYFNKMFLRASRLAAATTFKKALAPA